MQPNYESTVCVSCVGPLRHVQCLPACPAPGRIPCSSGLLPAISKLKLLLCKCCCSCCHGTQNQAGKEQGSCSSKENTNQTCKERASCTKERRSHCESRTWQQQQQQQGSDPGDQGSTQCSHHKPEAPNQSKESNRGTQQQHRKSWKNFGCIHNITSNATSMAACLSQLRITSRAPQRGRTRFLQGCSNQECRTLPGTPMWNR